MSDGLRQRRGEKEEVSSAEDLKDELAKAHARIKALEQEKESGSQENESGSQEVAQAAAAKAEPGEEDDENMREKVVSELMNLIQKQRAGPKPGLSDNAKRAKDILRADPYNLDAIQDLGVAYSLDDQWSQCANVMIRGFKRMKEFDDPDEGHKRRFGFLMRLAEASFRCKKYKQALAVFNDVEEPSSEDQEMLQMYNVMACQVYAYNGLLQKTLKAFNKGIEGYELERACGFWAATSGPMKRAELYDVAKQAIERLAKDDNDRQIINSLEKVALLREQIEFEAEGPKLTKTAKTVVITTGVLLVLAFLYLLHWLEQRSFASLTVVRK